MKGHYSIILMISFLLIGVVGSLIFISYSDASMEELLIQDVEKRLDAVVESKAEQVLNFVDELKVEFDKLYNEELFVRFLRLSSDDPDYNETFHEVLRWLDEGEFFGVGMSNREGIVAAADRRLFIGLDFSEVKSTKDIVSKGKAYSTFPEIGNAEVGLTYGERIDDPETGEFLGHWGILVQIEELRQSLGAVDEIGETAEIYLVSDEFLLLTPSRFLSGKNKGVLLQVIDTENAKKCFNESSIGHNVEIFLDYRGEEVLGVHREIPGAHWCLLMQVDKSEVIDRPLGRLILKNILFSLIGIIILSLIGLFIGKSLDKKGHRSVYPRKVGGKK